MKLFLKEGCHLVKGVKNSAIYDLNNEKVYSINSNTVNIIEKVIGKKVNKFTKPEEECIKNLINLSILTDVPQIYTNNKKPVKVNLTFAWLELTELCNLKCIHCYGEFGCPKVDESKVLSLDNWKEIIDELTIMGCKSIQFIGGEPMIYKHFLEILKYAHKKMDYITIFTNATFIDDENAKTIKECGANVRVSVYGHNASTHDKVTGVKGSFEKNKNGLLMLKKHKIKATIAIIIMKENEKYISQIKKYITDLGYVYNGYDVIRKTDVMTNCEHSVTDYEVLKKIYHLKPEFYINKNKFNRNHIFNSCWNSKIAITSSGDILPCVFARNEVAGNIKKNTKEEIRNNLYKYWKLTKDHIEVCKDCEFRYACHDCRPLGKGVQGNINDKNPRCCYDPYLGIWEELEKITINR